MTSSGYLVLPLGRLKLRVHLLLPVAIAAAWYFVPRFGPPYTALLGTLFLHETAHALSSLALGGRLAKVSLLPTYGWAAVERFPDRRECWAALAGPFANLLLAAGLALAGARPDLHLLDARAIDFLLTVNLAMGLGNLIPFPPLDGGRFLAELFRKPAPPEDPPPGDS